SFAQYESAVAIGRDRHQRNPITRDSRGEPVLQVRRRQRRNLGGRGMRFIAAAARIAARTLHRRFHRPGHIRHLVAQEKNLFEWPPFERGAPRWRNTKPAQGCIRTSFADFKKPELSASAVIIRRRHYEVIAKI